MVRELGKGRPDENVSIAVGGQTPKRRGKADAHGGLCCLSVHCAAIDGTFLMAHNQGNCFTSESTKTAVGGRSPKRLCGGCSWWFECFDNYLCGGTGNCTEELQTLDSHNWQQRQYSHSGMGFVNMA